MSKPMNRIDPGTTTSLLWYLGLGLGAKRCMVGKIEWSNMLSVVIGYELP